MFGFEYLGVNIWIKYFMDGCSAPNYVSLENAFGWNILWPQTFSAQNIHHHCYFGLHLLKNHSATKIMAIAWHGLFTLCTTFVTSSPSTQSRPRSRTGIPSILQERLLNDLLLLRQYSTKKQCESLCHCLCLYTCLFLVMSCLLTTLIKCLKGQKSLGCLI